MIEDFDNRSQDDSEPGNNLPVYVEPERKPFRRSGTNRIFLGLCGGISEYLRIDAAFIRILFSISILIGGWGVIVYLIASSMIPSETFASPEDSPDEKYTNDANMKLLIGNLLLLTGFFFTFNIYGIINYFSFVGIPPEIFGSVTLIFAGIYIYNRRNSVTTEKEPQPRLSRSVTNRRLSGFCGGLAEYLNTDSNVVRMVWLIFTFATLGLGFILYFIAWILVPVVTEPNE